MHAIGENNTPNSCWELLNSNRRFCISQRSVVAQIEITYFKQTILK